MTAPSTELATLTAIQDEARRQAINEIGQILIDALHKAGFRPRPGRHASVRNPLRSGYAKGLRGTPRSNSDQARVLRIIEKHPGSRGFQIVVHSAESGPPIKERTVRTALARLKKRGNVEMRDNGGWYSTGGHKL